MNWLQISLAIFFFIIFPVWLVIVIRLGSFAVFKSWKQVFLKRKEIPKSKKGE